jgi:hypothetical protein
VRSLIGDGARSATLGACDDLLVGFAVAGGVGADGDLPSGTPLAVRAIQFLLEFLVVGFFEAISAWVAFEPGERHVSCTLDAFGVERSCRTIGWGGLSLARGPWPSASSG